MKRTGLRQVVKKWLYILESDIASAKQPEGAAFSSHGRGSKRRIEIEARSAGTLWQRKPCAAQQFLPSINQGLTPDGY
jgi:hypothetical protein